MIEDETRDTRAVTTRPAHKPHDETMVPSWGGSPHVRLPEPGYQLGEMIGHGGMGEVIAAQDQRIGREVAVKRIRALEPSPDAVVRFLREARIQARLDHPAIVPVYELGTDAEGLPYFTMKRLTGITLAKRMTRPGPVQPMLRAFVDVCLAIQLAHSRGVVHRDLKPSNIMLGDYGEVYVLDWGVARVLTETKRTTGPAMAAQSDDGTTVGAILGTPGYMAPEQARGEDAGPKADVYALGAILFEILAGEPLHPRGEAALGSTLSSPQVAPARRASDRTVPPELDGVCFEALAENPDERPSARELADRVQAYLDGDRDLDRRRTLAAEQLDSARDALGSRSGDARATAMRRAGRALALDPESKEAAELVSKLLLEPPAEDRLPDDLREYLAHEESAFNDARSRQGALTYLSLFVLWALVPFVEVKSWTALLGFYALLALGATVSWRNSRRGRTSLPVNFVINAAIVLMFTRMAGPFVLTPIVICACLMQIAAMHQANQRLWLVLAWTAVATTGPFVLEWLGAINTTFIVQQGALISTSDIFVFKDARFLVATNIVFLLAAAVVAIFLSRRRIRAQRQLQIQAWHLRQLLPAARHTRVR